MGELKAIPKERVEKLEAAMLSLPQVECPVRNIFGPGLYVREMSAPAGALIIGHEHRNEHLCVLLQGTLRILRDDGTAEDVSAPATFTAKAGRKIAYVLEDIIFQNIFATEERDLEKLEAALITKSDIWTQYQLEEQLKALQGEST